jgi:hypothetical protein
MGTHSGTPTRRVLNYFPLSMSKPLKVLQACEGQKGKRKIIMEPGG